MRLMTTAIASTSGSFLVSNSMVTSQHSIAAPVLEGPPLLPQPNWDHLDTANPSLKHQSHAQLVGLVEELTTDLHLARKHIIARDGIIEGAHAQLVVQNLFVEKQSKALNTKETRKEKDCTMLFTDGKGRHLTDLEWIAAVEKNEADKIKEAAEKTRRARAREAKKLAKETAEGEWKRILEEYQNELQAWQEKCEELTAQKVLKKNLPKHPLRPKKPKMVVPDVPEVDQDHVGDGSESSDSD